MASGWNLWVWLQCIGVVSGCCCKEVIINFPYSTCISSASLLLCSFIYNIAHHVTFNTDYLYSVT